MDRKKYEIEINSAKSLEQLNELEIKYLGRNGEINKLLSTIKDIPDEEKREYGQKVNLLKTEIKKYIEIKKLIVSKQKSEVFFDKTMPGKAYPKGSLHIVSLAIEEITKIFEKIGFIRVSYPEVDWEYGAFESLNMPSGHPARDDVETSFIDVPAHSTLGKMVLTPHTSNGQNREMKSKKEKKNFPAAAHPKKRKSRQKSQTPNQNDKYFQMLQAKLGSNPHSNVLPIRRTMR